MTTDDAMQQLLQLRRTATRTMVASQQMAAMLQSSALSSLNDAGTGVNIRAPDPASLAINAVRFADALLQELDP